MDYQATVLMLANQNDAASDLAEKLGNFLATAIAAFNMAGANYSLLQDGFRNQIPLLQDQASDINVTLQSRADDLAYYQDEFSHADHEFTQVYHFGYHYYFVFQRGLLY